MRSPPCHPIPASYTMVNPCVYRIPALFTASFASCALGLLAVSGVTTSFLVVQAAKGSQLYVPADAASAHLYGHQVAYIGVLTGNNLYDDILRSDLMYLLSRICLFAGVAFGSFTAVLSWSLSSFISPTAANWKLLGVFAAIVAIVQMPIFLLFETEPCASFGSQACRMSNGSYYLILSTGCWLLVTIATQFMDPPRWADEVNAWRAKSHHQQINATEGEVQQPRRTPVPSAEFRSHGEVDIETDGESQAPLLKAPPAQRTMRAKQGYLSGLQTWMGERRWATTAELPKNQTDSLSHGDDEEDAHILENQIVPYHFENDTSALVLDVLPNGRRVGDEGKSIESFDDLDSIVKLAEEGRLPETSFLALAPPSRNASFDDENTKHRASIGGQYPNTERSIVVVDTSQKQSPNAIYASLESSVPFDESIFPLETTASKNHALKPIEASAATTPEATTDLQQQQQKESLDKTAPRSTSVIKNLTENLKKRSRARRSKTNKYALMDDDDMESTIPMHEVIFEANDSGELPDIPGTPTRQAQFPCFDPRALSMMRRSPPEEDDEYPDPIISYMGSNDSTSEEDSGPIVSSANFEDFDDIEDILDREFDSVASSDSSESSSSDEYLRSSRSLPSKQRIRRIGSRGYSSVRSVVSSTSLLDTFIAEETDADLLEDQDAPYDLVRSQSAPTGPQKQKRGTHDSVSVSTQGSGLFHPSTSLAGHDPNGDEHTKIQLAPVMTSYSPQSFYEINSVSSVLKASESVQESVVLEPSPDVSFDTEIEDPVDSISFSSDPPIDISSPVAKARPESHNLTVPHTGSSADNDEQNFPKVGSTFVSPVAQKRIEDRANNLSPTAGKWSSPVSPAMTAPETPSPAQSSPDISFQSEQESNPRDLSISFESEKSWKEERQMRGGIHAPLDDFDDSSTEDELSTSIRSTRSCNLVRAARIRRMQTEKVIRRTRARTQDPGPRRRRPSPSTMGSVVDKLDLQLIQVMRPLDSEYGPDESSL